MKTDEEVCHDAMTEILEAVLGAESHLLRLERVSLSAVMLRQHLSANGYRREAPVVGPSLTEYFDAVEKLKGLPRP